MVTAGGDDGEPWTSRLLGLFPTARPPVPALDTAGDRDVLADRALAGIADLFACYLLVELPALYLLDALAGGTLVTAAVAPALSVAALVPLYVTYSFGFEWRYSRTPGKVWRELTTVTGDGDPCTLRASAVRNLLRYVDLLGVPPLVVGVVSAVRSPTGRRLGDRLAGTVVVRTR
ncbi:RDD family protein [Halomarina halobia]|uniref:RDD family protein n=1 Tax=Halomarina halobia TaxID=3033386 RepID=A0ABD6A4T9_9EURY|nr:RDD family protein [Halomarina sp. PSR21]